MPRGAATARDDAVAALRLLAWAPRHLRGPISEAEATAALRCRRERREADFLALVRRGVYQNPPNPYRALLAHAGCELGDLTRLVRADGVEGALRALLRAGVYLTVDELQGRRSIVRGSLRLAGDPARFRNPAARAGVPLNWKQLVGDTVAWPRAPGGHGTSQTNVTASRNTCRPSSLRTAFR